MFLHPKHQTVHNQPVSTQRRGKTAQRVTGVQSPCTQMPPQICIHWEYKTKGINEGNIISENIIFLLHVGREHYLNCQSISLYMLFLTLSPSFIIFLAFHKFEFSC